MTKTEINARLAMLAKQRDDALNAVVISHGQNAVLVEKNKELEKEVSRLKEGS